MPLPSSMKPKDEAQKASVKESNESEEHNDQCLTCFHFSLKSCKMTWKLTKDLSQNQILKIKRDLKLNKIEKKRANLRKRKLSALIVG